MSPEMPREFGVLGRLDVPLGLGILRLATEGRPDPAEAIAVIHAALDAGIRVMDTADTYALDERDLHYGERLVRDALQSWTGERDAVRVITKVGLSRPKGRWLPDASPKRIRASVNAALEALGVESLFMLLLHVNDPKTPFEESLAALADVQKQGKARHLGVCNVGPAEAFQAQRHFAVAAVQGELSVVDRTGATSGLLAFARQEGIPFLAHRPMGGHAKADSLAKNRILKPLALRLGCSPHEAALAVVLDLQPPVLPLIGATRCESVRSCCRAVGIALPDSDRAVVAEKISWQPTAAARIQLMRPGWPEGLPELKSGAGPGTEAEVVIVMGVQGAGKSERVQAYEDAGYLRLNRDMRGGSLDDLLPAMEAALQEGTRRIVMDNTYPTRLSRYGVVRIAHQHNVPVRCLHLATPLNEAYVNVVLRMLGRYGRLLGPDDLKALAKTDPNLPPPAAMARWAAAFEPPASDEGFSAIETIPFVRRRSTGQGTVKGLLLDVDGTLRGTRSGELYPTDPEDVVLLPGRRETLTRWIDQGYRLFFVSNQSGVASGKVTAAAVEACFQRTIELLELPVEAVAYCPHPAFPVSCFCRKPLPGLGVVLMEKHGLARENLVMVGDMASDAAFAAAIGARFEEASQFFAT